MASSDSEIQKVISNLRACLISVKGGIPLSGVDRDYRVLVGHSIPFKKLGFDSLESFLKSVPDVSMSRTRTGETVLDVIPTKSTQHLASLVSKQKSAPKKVRAPQSNRRASATQWKPPPSSGWRRSGRFGGRRSPLSVTVNNKGSALYKNERIVQQVLANNAPINATNAHAQHHCSDSPFLKKSVQESCDDKAMQNPLQPLSPHMLPSSQSHVYSAQCKNAPTASASSQQLSSRSRPPLQSQGPPLRPVSAGAPVKSQSSVLLRSPSSIGPSRPQMTGLPSRRPPPASVNGDPKGGYNIPDDTVHNGQAKFTAPFPGVKGRMRNRKNPQVPTVIQLEGTILDSLVYTSGKDYGKELRQISKAMGWGEPTFRIVPRAPKGEPVMYGCIVKVGEHSYNSYPDEHIIPGESVQLACKIALEDLNKLYDGIGGDRMLPKTANKNLVMSRIAKIVAKHPNGLWSSQIPLDYKELYNESLPEDWLKLMGGCSLVALEFVASNRIIILPNERSADSLVATSPLKLEPEPLVFPEMNHWYVFVTNAVSTAEVWIRLIGDEYSVLYESMSTDMEIFYMENVNAALNPEVGMFYAVQVDGCWHRVQLEKLEGQAALVFFIDHGDEDVLTVDLLHVLETRFIQLPAQAIRCSLFGLEVFAEGPNAVTHLVDTIIGKVFVAEVISRGSDEDSTVSLKLFDTSTSEDYNVNQILAEKISQEVNAPQLPGCGGIAEVYVSHITESGELYIQMQSDSVIYLETLLRQVTEDGLNTDSVERAVNRNSDPSILYLGRFHEDMKYYRAKIVDTLEPNEVKVLFVDYGNSEVITSSELLIVKELSETLDNFPLQAIQVGLHNLPRESFNDKMLARVRDLIPDTDPVLIKVIESENGNRLPQVEVFKRISENNQLVSINNTLALDPEFIKPATKNQGAGDVYARSKILERLHSMNVERMSSSEYNSSVSPKGTEHGDVPPSRGLKAPYIPEVGSYFDVHVTLAANPGNFTVQPYKERLKLENLMQELQEFYRPWPNPFKQHETPKEGGLYAALYNDGNFYRVSVTNVISENLVSVYFCDFGDVAVLPQDKLQPLDSHFKELPYQAIKAKLSGIQPSHSDWSVEDCLMFQQRVVEHQFVSVIMERGPDLLNPNDKCLGLQLIDTSGEKDIHIDKLLVEENRAVFIHGTTST